MSALFLTSASGWAAVFLIAVTIALPYTLRLGEAATYRARIVAHVWIGCAILAFCIVHLIASLNPRIIGPARTDGISLAVAAFLVVIVQAILGRRLKSFAHAQHTVVRRVHLIGMIAIVVLTGAHMALNSPLIGSRF